MKEQIHGFWTAENFSHQEMMADTLIFNLIWEFLNKIARHYIQLYFNIIVEICSLASDDKDKRNILNDKWNGKLKHNFNL